MRAGPNYVSVDDVRAEGVDPELTDEWLWGRIAFASRQIETWTTRWFYARAATYDLDAFGQPILELPDPIVSISSVGIVCSDGSVAEIDPECYVVYNRHLTQGMTASGDQDSPTIEFRSDALRYRYPVSGSFGSGGYGGYGGYGRRGTFDSGNQIVRVVGRFGYTDPVQSCVTSVDGPFALADGDELAIEIDGGAPVVIVFSSSDFDDIGAATAAEVVAAVAAAAVPGVIADDVLGQVRISSATLGSSSSVRVVETTAAPGSVFGFPTTTVSYPDGVTPVMIQRAVLLMVVLDLTPLGDRDERWRDRHFGRTTERRTRDQSVKFGTASSSGGMIHQSVGMWTGDPEIDNIISYYYRPPDVAFVGGVDHDLADRPGTPMSWRGHYPPWTV